MLGIGFALSALALHAAALAGDRAAMGAALGRADCQHRPAGERLGMSDPEIIIISESAAQSIVSDAVSLATLKEQA